MKRFTLASGLLLSILCFSGCGPVGEKSASLSVIYAAAAFLALALLVGCIFSARECRGWFILLFSSVVVVNVGYALLSVSTGLEMALWANRMSYLGSVFLLPSMLMILLSVTQQKPPKWLHGTLGILGMTVFLIAASPGILPIYYQEVSFAVVNGVSTLVKVYGPLHPVYLFYLLGYFAAMVAVLIRASARKSMVSTAHGVVLTIAVFANLCVWLIEQLVELPFEMLSISYIISELFLLGAHLMLQQARKLQYMVESVQSYPESQVQVPAPEDTVPLDRVEAYIAGLEQLTPTEKTIHEFYTARLTTREVLSRLNITENTLKYHNRNLYGKLGVSSRKELLQIHMHLLRAKKHEESLK